MYKSHPVYEWVIYKEVESACLIKEPNIENMKHNGFEQGIPRAEVSALVVAKTSQPELCSPWEKDLL